jgi:Pyridoxamine 5'-phosphate oxidase
MPAHALGCFSGAALLRDVSAGNESHTLRGCHSRQQLGTGGHSGFDLVSGHPCLPGELHTGPSGAEAGDAQTEPDALDGLPRKREHVRDAQVGVRLVLVAAFLISVQGGETAAMRIKRSTDRVAQRKIMSLLRRLLDASTLCAIATVTRGGKAHINTAYFAWAPDLRVVWLSAPDATHSRNLRGSSTAAIAVFDSNQVWGQPDRGLQMFGSAKEVSGAGLRGIDRAYTKRFPTTFESDLIPYRFYVFHPRRVKVFDEGELGPRVFVTARVRTGGQVAWERTELYESRESEIEIS